MWNGAVLHREDRLNPQIYTTIECMRNHGAKNALEATVATSFRLLLHYKHK